MKLFTKSMEPNTTLGVAERVAYMSGNIGIALINTIVADIFDVFLYGCNDAECRNYWYNPYGFKII